MKSTEEQLIHDLRNVGGIIRGAAETLYEGGPAMSADMTRNVVAMLARRSDMLVRLIDDLATVHALNSGSLDLRLQAVDLAEVLGDVVEDHQDLAGTALDVEVGPGARALADPIRLLQVIDNLLVNAQRYGGSSVQVRAAREGDEVAISVSDDGPGIDPAVAASMFEEHARGASSRLWGGSGLGLAIVRELCGALGGGVTYDGSRGTTFTVRLPAVPQTSVDLGRDAARRGHTVSFWRDHGVLADAVAAYAGAGLVAGEAVVVALTGAHHGLVEERLTAHGFDVAAAVRRGQYLRIDAEEVRAALEVGGHVDRERFEQIIGTAVLDVSRRWRTFRVFGEIVDVYWREGNGHLSLELEACWNQLRSRIEFPLYCGYELTAEQGEVCGCHDAVLIA